MNSLNEVTLLGFVCEEPKVWPTEKGGSVVAFQVKTHEQYTNRDTQKTHDHYEWHDVKAFGFMADKCTGRVKNGARVLVRGRNRREKWKDEKDQPHSRTVIHMDDLIVLDPEQGSTVSEKPVKPKAAKAAGN